jgi:IPT/TIG domain
MQHHRTGLSGRGSVENGGAVAGSLGSIFAQKRARHARKRIRSKPVRRGHRHARLLGLAGVALLAPLFALAPFGTAAPSPLTTTAEWQQAISQPPTRGLAPGCYHAAYPSRLWSATKCEVAPEVPFEPAPVSSPANATVGNGTDYSAEVAGTISSATGSFGDVSPTITETGQYGGTGSQVANTFSLQLNTEFFSNSPACSGSANPSNCLAWQQFLYAYDPPSTTFVFMQYWLINYDAICPSGWMSYSTGASTNDCYTNSPASSFSGGTLTAADLASTQLVGSASPGGNDAVTLSFGGQATLVSNPDSVVDLAPNWNTAEFDVFGDGGGGEATFGASTTLEAQTTLSDSSLSAPTCVGEGFTAETNNLSLTNTPAIGTQGLPTIVSEQTNASPTTPSCGASPGSMTATTMSTSLSGGGSSGAVISVPTSTAVTDQATLSGTNAPEATGAVTYNVYSASNCSGLVYSGTAEPITTPGTLPASAAVTLNNAGTYYWQASYSGDTYNSSSTSSCGSEIVNVTATSPVPTVSKVSPNSGPTSGGTTIAITGTGFVAGATVVIGQGSGAGSGAIAATVESVTSTSITATTGGGAKAGTWSLYVTTPGGTSAANPGDNFTYDPVPFVSKVSPNAGPTGGGTAITITGTGFVSGAKVVIGQGSGAGSGAIPATVKSVTSTSITAATGGGAKAGTWSLYVTTPGGTSAANTGDNFTYDPVPTVTSVSPKSGPTTGGTAITISGTGFVSGAKVVIGQGNGAGSGAIAATNVTVVSSTKITALTGGGAKAGTWSLFVVTPGGTSVGNAGDNFTYS